MVRTLGQSMEKDILIAIHQLLSERRKPTVATVKSKLATSVSIPIIINVLQKTTNMNVEDVEKLLPDINLPSMKNKIEDDGRGTSIAQEIAALKQELTRTQRELNDLKQWVYSQLPKDKL